MKISSTIRVICFTFLAFFSTQLFAEDAVATTVSDSVITAKIKSKLLVDPSLSAFKVDVTTNSDGVVTLSGNVNSDTDAIALIQMAQSTDGVTDVDASGVTVKESKQPFADLVITAKVKGIFIRENVLKQPADNINVETNNGVVYLSGNVLTQKTADDAVNLAKTIKNVKSVESRIKVAK